MNEYIDGDPDHVTYSEYLQNKRKYMKFLTASNTSYFMKLKNNGIDDKEAVFLTMEQFPSLQEDGPMHSTSS